MLAHRYSVDPSMSALHCRQVKDETINEPPSTGAFPPNHAKKFKMNVLRWCMGVGLVSAITSLFMFLYIMLNPSVGRSCKEVCSCAESCSCVNVCSCAELCILLRLLGLPLAIVTSCFMSICNCLYRLDKPEIAQGV